MGTRLHHVGPLYCSVLYGFNLNYFGEGGKKVIAALSFADHDRKNGKFMCLSKITLLAI